MTDNLSFGSIRVDGITVTCGSGTASLRGAKAELERVGGKRKISGKRALLLGPAAAIATSKKEGGSLVLSLRGKGLDHSEEVADDAETTARAFVEAFNRAAKASPKPASPAMSPGAPAASDDDIDEEPIAGLRSDIAAARAEIKNTYGIR